MAHRIRVLGNIDIIKKILRKFPQYKKSILYYVAKELAKRGKNKFPIVQTGATRDAIVPYKEREHYTVGVRVKFLPRNRTESSSGKPYKSYLGKIQKNYKYFQVLQNSISEAKIKAIGQGFFDKVIKG